MEFDPPIPQNLLFTITVTAPLPWGLLTAEELQVIRLIAQGLSVAESARRLNCDERTVRRLKRRAMRQLGIRTTAELRTWGQAGVRR